MNNLHKEIGIRLKLVREKIFNEGVRLSASQFARLLGTTEDKIRNYELGRSSVPVEHLVKLYRKGINPVYILSGEGSYFAENKAGNLLRHRINDSEAFRNEDTGKPIKLHQEFEISGMSDSEKLNLIRAVAGNIISREESKP
jgi:transcriptional regulator with XRE-family HTH domain